MEFDSMAALAASDRSVGLVLHCHDDRCGRRAWRAFDSFAPDLTLRQLRRWARCSWCGSFAGLGVTVEIAGITAKGRWEAEEQATEAFANAAQRKAYIDAHPYGWRCVRGHWGYHPPDPVLLDAAHLRFGFPMCNLYSNTLPQEAMRRLFNADDRLGNQPPLLEIFPDMEAPIVRATANGGRELVTARWGWNKAKFGWVTNARNLDGWPWKTVIADTMQRCLVPATRFAEYYPTAKDEKGRKAKVWFERTEAGDDSAPLPFAFAGFWKRWDWEKDGLRKKADAPLAEANTPVTAFTFCTTEANDLVRPIHPKAMPAVLFEDQWERWLMGDADMAKKLASPAAKAMLRISA